MKPAFLLLLSILQLPLLAQRPELVVPIGHTMQVESVAFSPDGRYVLTGSRDATAKLWSVDGHEIQTFNGHTESVNSLAFAPDGQSILTGSDDYTAKLWTLDGREMQTFSGHAEPVNSVAFAPDGQSILTGSDDRTAKLWALDGQEIQSFSGDVESVAFAPDGQAILVGGRYTVNLWALDGSEIQSFSTDGYVSTLAFAPDGQTILTSSEGNTAKLWTIDGREVQAFSGHPGPVVAVAFAPDGQSILTGSGETAKRWALDGREIQAFSGHSIYILSIAFAPDGQSILTGSGDYTAKRWSLDGREIQSFGGHSGSVMSLAFAPDGRHILTGAFDKPAKLWALDGREIQAFSSPNESLLSVVFSPDGQYVLTGYYGTAKLWALDGREIQSFGGRSRSIISVAFSPDGQSILTGNEDNTAKLWALDGREIQSFSGHSMRVFSVAFAPDGQSILTGSEDNTAKLWALDGSEMQTFSGHDGRVVTVAFAPDGQNIVTGSEDNTAKLWALDGREIQTFSGHSERVLSVAFAPDGQAVLTGSEDNTAILWGLDGSEIQTFSGHNERIRAAFSPDGQYILTGSEDNTAKLWERSSGTELATLIGIDASDWVVTTPSGLFDASPGAMRRMHYVQGLEVIALEQLKERYYEPGLLAKLMGYNPEPIRDVSAMDRQLELYPDVALTLQGDQLDIALTPRGGGIGRVALYIDSKEVSDDVDPDRSNTIQIDLSQFEKYFQFGQPVQVGVQAWDRAGSLASQVQTTSYTLVVKSKGDATATAAQPGAGDGAMAQKIRLFALCIGSGDYNGGTDLDLSYAEQDAQQMGKALELAGKELFLAGPPEVQLLTTCKDCPDQATDQFPSKANIRKALEEIAEQAGPQDVVILYLSGHGITYDDYWYYLTYEMNSSVLTDKVIREERTISSSELKEWMADIPARKQVMIIDACASGKLNQDFDLLSQKDIPSSQIRALNRMGSRGGLYVISASTADQVSYEASPFGMGLLTYGLLQGMMGGALRESEYIDVDLLFSYAEDQVPKFADYINKTQKPMVYTPQGSESFDFGRVTAAVKAGIELAEPKPIFAKVSFVNPKKQYRDDLKLSNEVNAALRDYNYKGQKSPLIFVESDDMPQAYTMTGAYTVDGESISIEATVFKGEEQIGQPITLTGSTTDLNVLSRKLIAEAAKRVK